MTGQTLKDKIKAKDFQLKDVAEQLGMSRQNLSAVLKTLDVRSGLIEKIAEVIGEPVSYFYNEQPIFSVEDYAKIQLVRQELEYLKILCEDQRQLIAVFKSMQDACNSE